MEGDFHARGRQHFSVMNVHEAVTIEGSRITGIEEVYQEDY
jgi:hypothetical protein